jgi:hypothetical protein
MRTALLLLLLAITATLARPAQASEAQARYDAGVEAARAGDNVAATNHLLAAIGEGGRHPAVYHALGNAFYRQDDLGRAVAAWRRAAALAPRDGDIAANLERARRTSVDRLEGDETGLFFWQRLLSPAEGAGLAGLLAALGLAAGALRTWRSRTGGPARRVGAETIVLLLLAALLATSTFATRAGEGGAVVVAPEASARSALGPGGVELFVLHAGAEVSVVERADAHTLIALPDARKGWLPTAALVSAEPSAPFPRPAH